MNLLSGSRGKQGGRIDRWYGMRRAMATLNKAEEVVYDLKKAGMAVEKNMNHRSALARANFAVASVYQAVVMKMVGDKESVHIQGLHYAEPAEVKPGALKLLRKQVNAPGYKSSDSAMYWCLTNVIYVLDHTTFIDLSKLLSLLITACRTDWDLKSRYGEYQRLMLYVEETVDNYAERRGTESNNIRQVDNLHTEISKFLKDDENLRDLKRIVASGKKDARKLKNIMDKIDCLAGDIEKTRKNKGKKRPVPIPVEPII